MQQRGEYYFHNDYLYAPNGGYTGVYVQWNGTLGYLYSRAGYTQHYIQDDYIYGPSGWTHLFLDGSGDYKHIYGSSDEIPFL